MQHASRITLNATTGGIMGVLISLPSLFFFFQISFIFRFFQKPYFDPNLHNVVITFWPFILCLVKWAFQLHYIAAILLKASQKSAWVNHIKFDEIVKWSFFWFIDLFLCEQECRHCIRFQSRKKMVANWILEQGQEMSNRCVLFIRCKILRYKL